jgi:outer membrane lipoprotein LolB
MAKVLKHFKKIFTASIFIFLTGCATLPAAQAPQNQKSTWDKRAETLSDIQAWNLKAQIALRANNTAQTASLNWQQTHRHYSLQLFGPLGADTFILDGKPGSVTLQDPHGKTFHASSPETLLTQQTGWHLPVSDLFYWVRGLPVPGKPAQKHFDNFNHLTVLTQDGWNIRFLRYTSIGNVDLPSKIFMVNPQLNVKLIISEWHLKN